MDDVTAECLRRHRAEPARCFDFNGAFEVHNAGEVWALTPVGGPEPHHRRPGRRQRRRAHRQPDHAPDRHRRPEDDADQPQLHRRPGRPDPRRLRHQRLRQRALDLGRLRGPWPGLRRSRPPGHRRASATSATWAWASRSPLPHLDVAATTVDDSLGNNNGAIDPGRAHPAHRQPQQPLAAAASSVAGRHRHPDLLDAGCHDHRQHVHLSAPSPPRAPRRRHLPVHVRAQRRLRPVASTSRSRRTARSARPAVNFTVRVGAASGIGAPVTYTRTVTRGLAIPDGDPAGVGRYLDDHRRPGDRRPQLPGRQPHAHLHRRPHPAAQGSQRLRHRSDLAARSGCSATARRRLHQHRDRRRVASNDLNQSIDTDAPYTGSWPPAFNSPVWLLFGTRPSSPTLSASSHGWTA